MARNKIISMEIGNHTLDMAVCVDGKPKRFIQAELPQNIMRNDEIVSYDAMADFIKETIKENKIKCKKVALTLPDRKLLVRRVNLPLMTVSQLRVNLPYEFRMYITDNKEQFVYDYSVINIKHDKDDPKRGEMDLLAIALERDIMEKHIAMFQRAGLKLVNLAPECMAIKNIINNYEEEHNILTKNDYAILDLGAENIIIQFFSEGEFDITRTMEVGCYDFIKKAAEISDTEIHIAHMDYEMNRNNIQFNEEIIPLYDGISIEIMRIINFYMYNHVESDLDCIYVCGGGVHIEPFIESIRRIVDMEIKSIKELFTEESSIMDELVECPQILGMILE